MLISLNEIKKLVNITISDEELLKLIGSRLVEVESVDDWSQKYKKIYVVKVLSAQPIDGTHLHLCQIDAGDKLGHKIQVVCGAPNVHANMFAAWIAPGAVVPATIGTAEPFEISVRKLRGFESNGMLAAADELGLGTDHAGIIELSPNLATAGTPLAQALNLDDKIIEVENKSLTHRPDCFGLIGFAREVAGILGQPFKEPNLLSQTIELTQGAVAIENPDICPCYSYSIINLQDPLEKTPYFDDTAVFLAKAGMHSISKIVDITNVLMLMTGQPLHAFDYDKFLAVGGSDKPAIGVRLARADETLTLLDGKTINLTPNDILITSSDIPVALAGAMGGQSTMISATTRRVILESATFSLYHLRKTQMSHGIFSEAITRFTKGQPAGNCVPVLAAASRQITSTNSHAKVESASVCYSAPLPKNVVKITTKEINSLLGSTYSSELITRTLTNTGFTVHADGETLTIVAPSWRTDIHIKEDIIEEVGRLLGFDNLPLNFPLRPFVCPTIDPLLTLKDQIRTTLSDRLGANELLTYSFVSKALLKKSNVSTDDTYQIVNSISPELEVFRPTLIPSLLEKFYENLKAGHKDFTLYELNQVTSKSLGLTTENVPEMQTNLGTVTHGDFFATKALLLELGKSLGLTFELRPAAKTTYLKPLRSASLYLDGQEIGSLGELSTPVKKAFKLPEAVSALELTLDSLIGKTNLRQSPTLKLSKFPFVLRDLTFRVDAASTFSVLESKIRQALDVEPNLLYRLYLTSIFRKPNDAKKHLSFHLEIAHTQKTLNSAEISAIIEKITNHLSELGAEVI